MSVDEVRVLRAQLEELFGVSGAEILLDRPPGGWSDLVTNRTLDLRFAAFEERSDRKLEALEARVDLRFAAVDARLSGFEARMDQHLAAIEHKIDLQRADLLGEMERRNRSLTWVMVSTFVALSGVMVAALRF